MKATMPGTMARVLGGYRASLARSERVPVCHLADQPRGFPESLFPLYMEDDDALLRASHAHWLLVPDNGAGGGGGGGGGRRCRVGAGERHGQDVACTWRD